MFQGLFKWLHRQSLINQGLRCERKRAQDYSNEFLFFFDCSPLVRFLLLLFAVVTAVRIGMWNSPEPAHEIIVLTILLFAVSILLAPLTIRQIWDSNRLLTLTLLCFLLNFFVNKALFLLMDSPTFLNTSFTTDLLVPSALGPMLVTILISSQAGIFLVFLLSIANNIFLGGHEQLLTSSLLTGLAGVYFTRDIRSRSNLLTAGVAVGFVGLACALVQGGLAHPSPMELLTHAIWAVFLGIATAFVVSAVLPVFEWMFDRITDISWLELTDLNHPLLKRLSMEAPGTFHHSLGVGNLAESAATVLPSVNPTMCRVLSYFHDIGKLTKPAYFIENTNVNENPHNELTPSMSALVIIAHVKEGVDRAIKHHLPRPIIDVIQQHHGTTLVYYFYRKAVQLQQDAREGGEILKAQKMEAPEVDESSFRYPGPIPQFKESALVSLADSIESSSRNLQNPTPQSIETLVHEIIEKRIQEGQLEESGLTLGEIRAASERFIFTLKNMLHARIQYPKDTKDAQAAAKEKERDSGRSQPSTTLPLIHTENS